MVIAVNDAGPAPGSDADTVPLKLLGPAAGFVTAANDPGPKAGVVFATVAIRSLGPATGLGGCATKFIGPSMGGSPRSPPIRAI